jgi:hypothetical protein
MNSEVDNLDRDLAKICTQRDKGKVARQILDRIMKHQEEVENIVETFEIKASPKLAAAIEEAERDIEEGRVHDWSEVAKELKRNGKL